MEDDMDLSSLENKIFLLAYEEYGVLWEAYGEAEDMYGNLSRKELMDKSRNIIQKFVDLGWVEFYWCYWAFSDENITRIESAEITKVLSEDKYWKVPEEDELMVEFCTTPEGDQVFKRRFCK